MMQKSLLIAIIVLCFLRPISLESQTLYEFYDSKGNSSSLENIIELASKQDIIFFGELHNNPVSHWASLEIINGIHTKQGKLWFGLEMFERDQQMVLNDLNDKIITPKDLKKYTRTWPNFETDYLPLVKMAHQNGYQILATNIPRQYASYVYKHGIDSLYLLDIESHLIPKKGFIIDTTLSSYAALQEMAASMGMGHGANHFLAAQAVKDACMAQYALQNFEKGDKLFHLNGAYHTKNKEGIIWYIQEDMPDINILSIQTIEVDDPGTFEVPDDNKSDFYLIVNKNITKSYE